MRGAAAAGTLVGFHASATLADHRFRMDPLEEMRPKRCFGQDRRWESILWRRPPSKEALVVRLLSCGASLTFWANATGQSPEPHPLRSIAAAIPEAPMGILISFGSSGGEWVTRFPFYESGYASPSWRRCYMMAAGAFEVPLVALRVVIFGSQKSQILGRS